MIGKILVTVAIIVAVWKGFALVGKLAEMRRHAATRAAATERRRSMRHPSQTLDLVRCERCGAYHEPGTSCTCGSRNG